MNGHKAKALRKQIYGSDYLRRNPYQYHVTKRRPRKFVEWIKDTLTGKMEKKEMLLNPVTIYCFGKRSEYLKLKKEARDAD